MKIKTKRKRKLDGSLFHGENDSTAFKNYQVFRPESLPAFNDRRASMYDLYHSEIKPNYL